MHFKAGQQAPKATLEIGDKTYKILAPTVGQADEFSVKINQLKDTPEKINELMKQYICDLGSIPMDDLNKVENDLFVELFSYVVNQSKKK